MTRLEISHCSSCTELDQVVELCGRAFQNTPLEYFKRHILCDATLRPENTLIGRKGGRILSSVQIFPRVCWVEGRRMRFAGIGNVATDPAEQKQGYAGQLLTEAIRRMKDDGFLFSTLTTSINNYYAKFGYVSVPREVAFFANAPAGKLSHGIRLFSRHRDYASIRELYERYNREGTGPIARDEQYWEAQFQFCGEDPALFFILEHGGHLAGYIRGAEEKGVIQILEFGAPGDIPAAFKTLLGAVCAARPGKKARLFLCEREKRRLASLPEHTLQRDTDTMVLPLDQSTSQILVTKFMSPGEYMFWSSDFF